jgi:hypothetical protein
VSFSFCDWRGFPLLFYCPGLWTVAVFSLVTVLEWSHVPILWFIFYWYTAVCRLRQLSNHRVGAVAWMEPAIST